MNGGQRPRTVVVERATGAQILPHVGDGRATASAWSTHLACDADLRAKHRAYRELAERMEVRMKESHGDNS